jgi:DHA2 family multidrug resistance protein
MQLTFGAVVFAVVFLVPNYFSELQGFNASEIGLAMIPYGLVQFVMSFLTPPLMRKFGVRTVIVVGFAAVAFGCLMNVHLDLNSSGNVIIPSLIVRGIGQSLVVVALSVMAVQGLDKSQLGSASGLFSTVRNLGGAIGIAGASQIVVEREKFHAARIGEALSIFGTETRERTIGLVRSASGLYVGRFDALNAPALHLFRTQAFDMLRSLVHRDALFFAYSDTFLIAGIAMGICALGACVLKSKGNN